MGQILGHLEAERRPEGQGHESKRMGDRHKRGILAEARPGSVTLGLWFNIKSGWKDSEVIRLIYFTNITLVSVWRMYWGKKQCRQESMEGDRVA